MGHSQGYHASDGLFDLARFFNKCCLGEVDSAQMMLVQASEAFLQRMVALYASSHYKNTPNDLILMSDAPAHHLFALLGPVDETQARHNPLSPYLPLPSFSSLSLLVIQLLSADQVYVLLIILCDAPAHHLFALLGPDDETQATQSLCVSPQLLLKPKNAFNGACPVI